MIVLVGDHGWSLSEHGLWAKHSNFEVALRVPLIISSPEFEKNKKTNSVAELIDLYPTLCELSSGEKPKHLQGNSLVESMSFPSKIFKTHALSRWQKGDTFIKDKLFYTEWNLPNRKIKMLYDHSVDPSETINLANLTRYNDIVNSLGIELKQFKKIIQMNNIKYFYLTFILLSVNLFGQNDSISETENRPNIVFIMSDDHAVSAVSAYNDWLAKIAPTPNIDRIAENGMLMNRVFNTNSICGPSRASILTGKYSHVNGFFKNEKGGDFDGTQITFPKILQRFGYETAVIGKWHLGTAPTGFDYSKVMINWGGQGTYFNPVFLENGKDTIVEKNRHSTAQVAYDAINWLEKSRDKSKPFMLMYQFKAPHRPWEPAKEFKSLFKDGDLPHPENFNDEYVGREAAKKQWMEIENHMNRRDLKIPAPKGLSKLELNKYYTYGNKGEFWTPNDSLKGKELKNWKFQRYIKDYLRCVAGVDKAVGQMLDYLEENKLMDNTIIIYTSDQGFYLGEHGWFDKRWMYEESFRMPFVISYPKVIKPKTTNSNLLLNIDFAPTLLDLAEIDIPKDIQGTSFVPQLKLNNDNVRDAIYYHYYEYPKWHMVEPHYGIRTKRFKLIHFYYSMDEWELYDLDKDPNEMNNLYKNPMYKTLIKKLKIKLKELQKEFNDDMSLKEMREMTDVVIERVYNEDNLKTR